MFVSGYSKNALWQKKKIEIGSRNESKEQEEQIILCWLANAKEKVESLNSQFGAEPGICVYHVAPRESESIETQKKNLATHTMKSKQIVR